MQLNTFRDPLQPVLIPEVVERLVRSRTGVTVRSLRVEVEKNHIVICGRAATYYTKQLATHAVLDALPHVRLTNEIEVF